MRVAAYQAPLLPGGSMEALELISDRIKWCEAEGVDILCCPEVVLGGLADDAERPVEIAIESSQLEVLLSPLASKSVTAIVGFTEIVGAGKLYNAAAVLHQGRIAGVYRKRHPASGPGHHQDDQKNQHHVDDKNIDQGDKSLGAMLPRNPLYTGAMIGRRRAMSSDGDWDKRDSHAPA
jgi:predicted amidohydrolase